MMDTPGRWESSIAVGFEAFRVRTLISYLECSARASTLLEKT